MKSRQDKFEWLIEKLFKLPEMLIGLACLAFGLFIVAVFHPISTGLLSLGLVEDLTQRWFLRREAEGRPAPKWFRLCILTVAFAVPIAASVHFGWHFSDNGWGDYQDEPHIHRYR